MCTECRQRNSSTITRTVYRLPEILTLHLMGFDPKKTKNCSSILAEKVLIFPHVSYQLVSVINHRETTISGGHHTTTRLIAPNCVTTYDDSKGSHEELTQWSSPSVESEQAYLLFEKQTHLPNEAKTIRRVTYNPRVEKITIDD